MLHARLVTRPAGQGGLGGAGSHASLAALQPLSRPCKNTYSAGLPASATMAMVYYDYSWRQPFVCMHFQLLSSVPAPSGPPSFTPSLGQRGNAPNDLPAFRFIVYEMPAL